MIAARVASPLALALLLPAGALGQPAVPLRPGTTLFQLDLAGTPLGEIPTAIKQLGGSMTVVVKDGMPMLKASAASVFLITLSQPLPQDFTLEFDLVPKLGSNPQDLSFEGTPTINQDDGSAHVLWHATGSLSVIGGGGDNYESPMPKALRATLPGVLTHVVADFQGPTIKLYTNGERHYTLDKQFARGRVLRVFLGGQDDGTEAVYLAGLRISTGSGLGIIAAQAGLPPRTQPAPLPPGGAPATGSSSSGVTGTTSGSASTITTVGGSATQPIRTPAASPAATPVNQPSGPGVTAAPRPAGATTSSATSITQPPGITNLTATVGPLADNGCIDSWCPDWRQANGACVVAWCPDWLQGTTNGCIISWCPDWRQGMSARKVTWSWTPPPGIATAMTTFDLVATDPATGQLTTTRLSGNPVGLSSGASTAVVEGATIRICVAAQADPSDPTKLVGETCLDTQVPGSLTGQQPAALGQSPLPVVPPSPAPTTASNTSAMTGTLSPAVTPTVSVKQGSAGPMVDWTPIISPGVYTVQRWKIDDALCCNNTSPASPPLTSPPWQDSPPQQAGTYVYQVTLTTSSGVATGQTQFQYGGASVILAAPPTGTALVSPTPLPSAAGTGAQPPPPPPPPTVAVPPAAPPNAPAPISSQAGLPTLSTSQPAAGSISLIPTAPPPVSTYFTGTPAWVRVSWTMGSGISRTMLYNVERYLESNPTCCVVRANGLTNIGWTDEGTQWPGTYVYTITAVYPDGSTGSIQAKWIRPDPVNPTNFRATVLGSTVVLQWDAVPNVDWYELFGPALPYTSFQVVPPLTQFNVRNLAPGTYTWLVGSFYSSPKAPATVSSAAAAFPKVTVTVP